MMPLVKSRGAAHDGSDLARWANEHYDAVFRFCVRRVGPDRAADVAQETFVSAQRALGRFRGESTPLTWLLGIAHNHCRRLVRRDSSRPTITLAEYHEPPVGGDGEIIDRQLLAKALAELSPEHREVVILHEIEGRSHEEIGLILGIPAGTVKSRLHYAFRQLRLALFPEASHRSSERTGAEGGKLR